MNRIPFSDNRRRWGLTENAGHEIAGHEKYRGKA